MATSGRHNNGEDTKVEGLTKWPLEYVKETKEYVCGWCSQVLTPNQTTKDLETHLKSCKNSKESDFLLVFKGLIKINQKFEGLEADTRKKVDKMKAEVMEEIKGEIVNIKTEIRGEIENKKTEFKKDILKLKLEIEKELEKLGGETSEGGLSTLFGKVKALEDAMKEKMAEVNGRVSGVAETISTVVHSMIEVKGKIVTSSADNTLLSNELVRSEKGTEALWVHLTKSERKTTNVRLEEEVERLKARMETISEQMQINRGDLQILKKRMKEEREKNEFTKTKSFHVEPFPFDHLAIPMNCFNLVTHNYLFQPSYKWTIDGIKTITTQKTIELTSDMFQWRGYPVQARAKLQLKEDDCVYLSLSLKEDSEPYDFAPIPRVYYLLKDINARNPKHKSLYLGYLFKRAFTYSLSFGTCLGRKSWLNFSTYNVSDSVEIDIYVEPPPMTQQVHSYDGTLEWSIENYKRRLRVEKEGLVFYQESPYLYTSPRGYRVQVKIKLNGIEGEKGGGGPSARIVFLSGKFDAELPDSFPYSTTVTLLNRKEPEKSITKTIVEDIRNKKFCNFEMCKSEEVENLIENDTLYCKVSVQSQ